jgi:signal peptidase I
MRKFFWSFLEIFETIFIAAVTVFLVRTFIAQPFLVSGSSMEPTFHHGNYLLVDELVYRFREPLRGEVIVFKYPGDNRSYYIKRIIGLPGERVEVKNGKVAVYDGKERKILSEPYIANLEEKLFFEVTLGEGEYFVMGDNRSFSFDSRNWGPLPRKNIIGLVRFRLWPVSQAMAFSAPTY